MFRYLPVIEWIQQNSTVILFFNSFEEARETAQRTVAHTLYLGSLDLIPGTSWPTRPNHHYVFLYPPPHRCIYVFHELAMIYCHIQCTCVLINPHLSQCYCFPFFESCHSNGCESILALEFDSLMVSGGVHLLMWPCWPLEKWLFKVLGLLVNWTVCCWLNDSLYIYISLVIFPY